MQYNYSKLKGKIVEKFLTQSNFAKEIGISNKSLSDKLNNKRDWTQRQIDNSCKVLGISSEEIPVYFFDF